ncbi:hypothetical protein H5410_002765 [Solanum commersonii]|uniref:Uncharacterized protein n=1 Tax=Solanum commersonii TaxID=4109 RepID=A0A9J6B332_SOLCO|nr:hypothetical protein H5410_002765 [Solanum commersonii]
MSKLRTRHEFEPCYSYKPGISELSYAGRLQIVNVVFFLIFNFWGTIFILPQSVLKAVDRKCKDFVWGSTADQRKAPLVSWDEVCLPKKFGGLNVKGCRKCNEASIGKLLWQVSEKQDILWVKWVHGVYIKQHRNIWNHKPPTNCKWVHGVYIKLHGNIWNHIPPTTSFAPKIGIRAIDNKKHEELEEKEENNQNNLPEIKIDEINDNDPDEQRSKTSETYTELLANIDNTKDLEVNTGDIDMDGKPSTSGNDKATQTETEEEDTIEKILKAITTLCTKVDSMDNEIQKLKTNEDNSKSKATPTEILYEEIKPPIQVVKIGLTKDMIIPEDIGQQPEIQKNEIPSFYANKRIIGISTIIQDLANNYLNGNAIWSYYARDQLMIYSNSRELRKADMD